MRPLRPKLLDGDRPRRGAAHASERGTRRAAGGQQSDLFAIGGDSGTDVYSEPRFSLDLGSSYAINDSMSLYLNAKNLTNTALKFAEGKSDRTIQREFYGATYQFGATFNF